MFQLFDWKKFSGKYRKCSNYLIGRNSLENIENVPIIDWKKFSREDLGRLELLFIFIQIMIF